MKRFSAAASAAVLALALFGADASAQSADSVLHVQQGSSTLMRLNSDGGFVVQGAESGVLPATGEGRRFMWVPSLGAIRAGQVNSFGATYWDPAGIGAGSAAFGENTRASGAYSFAAGRAATASGEHSVAAGGYTTASANNAVALGYYSNATAPGAMAFGNGAQATGDDALAMGPSSIAGGLGATVIGPSIANGPYSVAIGLQNSASGMFSVAIGKNARTHNRQGSIVLGDGCASFSSDSVYATANNQIVMRGCGGVNIFTNQGLTSGVQLAPGGSSWSAVSDRNRKENFEVMDGEEVLRRLREVEVSSWNYLSQESEIRHAGPMAQDFYAAFGLGESDLLISSIDIDGVNMAAVKGLDDRTLALQAQIDTINAVQAAQQQRVEELSAVNSAQQQRVEDLEAEVALLHSRLKALEALLLKESDED